jgi:hypothetical protein
MKTDINLLDNGSILQVSPSIKLWLWPLTITIEEEEREVGEVGVRH